MSAHATLIPDDRFAAFAFVGADLLVEAGPEGQISFAAGSFRTSLGMEPEQAVGQHLTALVAPAERAQFSAALARIGSRGRLSPMVVRLNDPRRTPASVAAMMVAGHAPRLCVTFGPVPVTAGEETPGEGRYPLGFVREAEARVRDGATGQIALVEVKGLEGARAVLSDEALRTLRQDISMAVAGAPPSALAGEIAVGRIGVLTEHPGELPEIVERLEALLRATPATQHMQVDSASINLSRGRLSPAQAARALRYALSEFGQAGAAGARSLGGDGGLDSVISRAEDRARTLRSAIAERRFRLRFQPVVSLADRRVKHYEALLRPFGLADSPAVSPGDFVTFVEAMNLSEELDYAVVEQALVALRTSPNVAAAVNISGLSLQRRSFCDRFLALLRALPESFGKRRLLVELTETAEIDDMDAAAGNIERLRDAGIPVCLDDFGAGSAAFRYLRAFKFDYVKIDGLYVHRASMSVRERSFVTSMVELATGVGARVVAEMVETEEQARLMRTLGVEYGQGWLFGREGMLPGARR